MDKVDGICTAEYTCIVCPVSCRICVEETEDGLKVSGNQCKRGEKHALAEHTRPMRMLTTTVKLNHGRFPRIPVISEQEIPKSLMKQCLEILYQAEAEAPVACGDVIINNICGTGVDIVAARSMERME